jgi:hypothetical protein
MIKKRENALEKMVDKPIELSFGDINSSTIMTAKKADINTSYLTFRKKYIKEGIK